MGERISAPKPEPASAPPALAEAVVRPEGEAVARGAGPPGATPSWRSAGEVLRLQRLVGNQAVQRLLAGRSPSSAGLVMRQPAAKRSVSSVSTVSDPGSRAMRVILKPATGLAEILLPEDAANAAVSVDVTEAAGGLRVLIQVTPGARVTLNPGRPADVRVEVRVVPWPAPLPLDEIPPAEGLSADSLEGREERFRDGPVLISPVFSGPKAQEQPAAPPPSAASPQPAAKPVEPAPETAPQGAAPQNAAPANPYAAMTVEERAETVRKLLDKWFSGRDILRVFEACDPREFIILQRKVDLAAVLDKLDTWEIVKLAARGPILAPHRQKVNEERADLLVDITHKWGPERAQIFAHYIFASMTDDDVDSVLRLLAAGQHLHDTVDLMPLVGKLFADRGIDRSRILDRDWEALDIARGLGRGIDDILSTSEAARGAEGSRAMGMALDLPAPYREAVHATDMAAFERAFTPGNVAFGTADYMTMGLLSTVKGVVYDIPKGIASGVGEISKGHVASGVGQLTGPAIFLVTVALGVRGFRKNARLAAMLELTEEGGALYGTLKSRIGAQGIDKVAKWVQGSAEAQILVREHGAAGIEALHRAQGNVVAARAELAASREAAARVAPASTPAPVASSPPVQQPPAPQAGPEPKPPQPAAAAAVVAEPPVATRLQALRDPLSAPGKAAYDRLVAESLTPESALEQMSALAKNPAGFEAAVLQAAEKLPVRTTVPGLYAGVKTDARQGPWSFTTHSYPDSPGSPRRTISTDVRLTAPDGKTYSGSVTRIIEQRPNAAGGHDVKVVMDMAFLDEIPAELRWVQEGAVPLRAGKGIPLQTYVTLMQMKSEGVVLGSITEVKMSTIINARTCLELESLTRRFPNISPDKLIERTQSGTYGMTNVTQAGSRVKGMKVSGGTRKRVGDIIRGTEMNDDVKLKELGLTRADEVPYAFDIKIDVEPAPPAGGAP